MSDCDLKTSKVHGEGIFAIKPIAAGKILFETHSRVDDERKWANLVPNCLYNHSRNPNCASVTYGDWKYLVTLHNIAEGEELLVDYNKDPDLERPQSDWV